MHDHTVTPVRTGGEQEHTNKRGSKGGVGEHCRLLRMLAEEKPLKPVIPQPGLYMYAHDIDSM